ncbi:MAG: Rpn family recombination-promoting nuclease/putative transposase [Lachnospiraceae bacterium]|nr:Rpn family recombination-promoting nuclease/putative transposase [Lachnospiraceae bacterium]
MSGKDLSSKRYMEMPEHFADAFNYYLYKGRQVISGSDLEEKDPEEFISFGDPKKNSIYQKYRDILRGCIIRQDKKTTYVLLGVENQSDLHYAIPVKNLLYDSLNYAEQVRRTGEKHRKDKDRLTSGEFLSGFTKEDRIIPVITLVIYWDDDEWDAPRRLSDMYAETDTEVSRYLMDYEVNLITPREITDFDRFSTELGDVLEVIKKNNAGIPITEMLLEKGEDWTMSRLGVEVINDFTKANLSLEEEKGDEVKMGRAFELLVEQGIEQGIDKGVDKHAIELICKKLKKGKDVATIADEIEESEEYVSNICKIAEEYAPEYDVDKILEKLWEQKKAGIMKTAIA